MPCKVVTETVRYPRLRLLALAVAYLLFVVYGSLVPLEYRALPLEEAFTRFSRIPYLDLAIESRADWVANVLLFVPLAFLWLGVLWHQSSVFMRGLASVAVVLAAFALSVGIEFTQLFFPPRTVSQNDILAEVIGAAAGIVTWWWIGQRVVQWFAAWQRDAEGLDMRRRLLYVYLAGLFAYNLLPLDLTISPVEIFHKFRDGHLILIPFGGLPREPAKAIYEIVSDIVVWVPVGLLWWRTVASRGLVVRNTVLIAALLEILQLFVYSRVSDVTDILSAGIGGWLGVLLAGRVFGGPAAPAGQHHGEARTGVFWLGTALLWLGVVIAVFWYPFDFNTEGQFLRDRLIQLKRVPFYAYYYGTEFRAATEVLHKVLFFAPLGMLSGWGMARLSWPRLWAWTLGLAFVCGAAALIEGGQLALPGKNADLTDWALEFSGGAFGLWFALLLAPRKPRHRHHRRTPHA